MSANVKEYSELKKRAMLAKQRMRMGYWQSMTDEKNRALEVSGFDYASVKRINDLQRAKFERDVNKTMNNAQVLKDEALYERVKKILDKDEDVSNPLGMLIEQDIYDAMDESNKQRYILELSKKFLQMRERYYRERLDKSC